MIISNVDMPEILALTKHGSSTRKQCIIFGVSEGCTCYIVLKELNAALIGQEGSC